MKTTVSAGGIVVKAENNQTKICLIQLRSPMEGYVFPKGHIESDETYEQTALREVSEETGLSNLVIQKKLGVVRRQSIENDGTAVTKDIHLYLMSTDNYRHGKSDETYRWFTIRKALEILNFIEEKEFILKHQREISSVRPVAKSALSNFGRISHGWREK